MTGLETRQRLDKWLWFARIVRTRVLAAKLVADGQVRVNRVRVVKPGHGIVVGDILTVAAHGRVRVLEVQALAPRRGPAAEARALYRALAMPNPDGGALQKEDATGPGTC